MNIAIIASLYRNSQCISLILLTILHVVLTYTHWALTEQGRITSKVSQVNTMLVC